MVEDDEVYADLEAAEERRAIRLWGDERVRRLVYAVAINLCCMVALCLMFNVSEKTDDLIMKLILSGAMSGEVDAHLLYTNYFLGLVLSLFQTAVPTVAWFEVSQFCVIFVSLTVFTYIMLGSKKPLVVVCAILPVLLFFGFECYIKLTFTKTAAVAVGSGFFALLHGFRGGRVNLWAVAFGLLQIFVGTLYRWSIVKSVCVLFICVLLLEALYSSERVRFTVHRLIPLVPVVLILVLAFGVKVAGQAVFDMDPDWAAYHEYNTYKVELQDYGWPDYKSHKAEYEALGISRADYDEWVNRDYGDPDLLSVETLAKIVDMKEPVGLSALSLASVTSFLERYPFAFKNVKVIGALIVLLFLLCISRRPRKAVPLLVLFVVIMLEFFYLYINGRYGRNHVDTSIAFAVAMCLCYYLYDADFSRTQAEMASLLLVVMCFWSINTYSSYMTTAAYTGSEPLSRSAARHTLDALTEGDDDTLYVLSNDEYYGLLHAYGSFESPASGSLNNFFILSGYMNPSLNSVLAQRGIDNVYKHLCDEGVRYVTTSDPGNVDTVLGYLKDNYYPDAASEKTKSVKSAALYKFGNDRSLDDGKADGQLSSDGKADQASAGAPAANQPPAGGQDATDTSGNGEDSNDMPAYSEYVDQAPSPADAQDGDQAAADNQSGDESPAAGDASGELPAGGEGSGESPADNGASGQASDDDGGSAEVPAGDSAAGESQDAGGQTTDVQAA